MHQMFSQHSVGVTSEAETTYSPLITSFVSLEFTSIVFYLERVFLIQVASEEERSKEGNQSPNSGSIQGSPRRVLSETLLIDRVAPLLRRMRHSQSMGLDKRLTPEPKPTIERFLEA